MCNPESRGPSKEKQHKPAFDEGFSQAKPVNGSTSSTHAASFPAASPAAAKNGASSASKDAFGKARAERIEQTQEMNKAKESQAAVRVERVESAINAFEQARQEKLNDQKARRDDHQRAKNLNVKLAKEARAVALQEHLNDAEARKIKAAEDAIAEAAEPDSNEEEMQRLQHKLEELNANQKRVPVPATSEEKITNEDWVPDDEEPALATSGSASVHEEELDCSDLKACPEHGTRQTSICIDPFRHVSAQADLDTRNTRLEKS